jgi:UrcA family protein
MLKSIAISGLILASAPALAQPPARTIRTSDLDLATPAGVARLDGRIERAVAQLCGSAFPTDLDAQAEVARCRNATMASVSGQRSMLLAHASGRGLVALKGR